MLGLDAAAGAAGLFGLSVTLFQGCVKGFVLLATAQDFGKSADLARCKIEIEQYRLFEWAESIDLVGNPNRNLNWKLIEGVLRQLFTLMTDVHKLKRDYDLVLEPTDEHLNDDHVKGGKDGLRGRLAWLKPKFLNENANRLHNSSTPWKRLRWSAIDEKGIRLLIADITYLNNSLYELLDRADRESSRVAFGMMMRNLIEGSSSATELKEIPSLLNQAQLRLPGSMDSVVAAAASLKQTRLVLGYDEGSSISKLNATSSTTSSATLTPSLASSHRKLSPGRGTRVHVKLNQELLSEYDSTDQSCRRELGKYDGEVVLIEWKWVEKSLESKLKHRIEALASLLASTSDPSFHALNCRGFLREPKSGRYAYVFTPPSLPPPSSKLGGASYEVMSLLHLLRLQGNRPQLNERITLATALTETVLQLHTSGWLHKGIRSENILFFNCAGHDWTSTWSLSPVFLAGYEYARADNPLDMTEAQSARYEADIYRHPSLTSVAPASYRKQFDLYSLGCVLLEIGLWRCLQTTLLRASRVGIGRSKVDENTFLQAMKELDFEDKREIAGMNRLKLGLVTKTGHGSIHEELKFATGSKFAKAVMICFSCVDVSDDGDDDIKHEGMLHVEQRIIETLRSCKV
jgi:hypothetical protein